MTVYTPLKQDKKQDQHEPKKWGLVLHMRPGQDIMLTLMVAHVLCDHVRVSQQECTQVVQRASLIGRALIKTVTRDVGETIMEDVRDCDIAAESTDFKIALEEV